MPTPYTRRVVAAAMDTPGDVPIYTHTGPLVLILRDLVAVAIGGTNASIGLYLTIAGRNYWLWRDAQPATPRTFHQELRQEMLAGETLHLFCSSGGLYTLLTGYFLQP